MRSHRCQTATPRRQVQRRRSRTTCTVTMWTTQTTQAKKQELLKKRRTADPNSPGWAKNQQKGLEYMIAKRHSELREGREGRALTPKQAVRYLDDLNWLHFKLETLEETGVRVMGPPGDYWWIHTDSAPAGSASTVREIRGEAQFRSSLYGMSEGVPRQGLHQPSPSPPRPKPSAPPPPMPKPSAAQPPMPKPSAAPQQPQRSSKKGGTSFVMSKCDCRTISIGALLRSLSTNLSTCLSDLLMLFTVHMLRMCRSM